MYTQSAPCASRFLLARLLNVVAMLLRVRSKAGTWRVDKLQGHSTVDELKQRLEKEHGCACDKQRLSLAQALLLLDGDDGDGEVGCPLLDDGCATFDQLRLKHGDIVYLRTTTDEEEEAAAAAVAAAVAAAAAAKVEAGEATAAAAAAAAAPAPATAPVPAPAAVRGGAGHRHTPSHLGASIVGGGDGEVRAPDASRTERLIDDARDFGLEDERHVTESLDFIARAMAGLAGMDAMDREITSQLSPAAASAAVVAARAEALESVAMMGGARARTQRQSDRSRSGLSSTVHGQRRAEALLHPPTARQAARGAAARASAPRVHATSTSAGTSARRRLGGAPVGILPPRQPAPAARSAARPSRRANPSSMAAAGPEPTAGALQTAVRRANRTALAAPHILASSSARPAPAPAASTPAAPPPALHTTSWHTPPAVATGGRRHRAIDGQPAAGAWQVGDFQRPADDEGAQMQLALERSVAEASEEERQITLALAASAADAGLHGGDSQICLPQAMFDADLGSGMADEHQDELSLLLAQDDMLSWGPTAAGHDGAQDPPTQTDVLSDLFAQLAGDDGRAAATGRTHEAGQTESTGLAECEDEMLMAAMADSLRSAV